MVLGFNHNLMYKGEVFHVQTEDSGVSNPHIITLLYRGGVIISSRKTSYSDILKMDNLEVVVEELMKEQHKDMMRRLKAGEFDQKAFAIKAQLIENYEIPSPAPESDPVAELFGVKSASVPADKNDISMLFELPVEKAGKDTGQLPKKAVDELSGNKASLDDTILSFFGTNEK
jgi:hypothetical protein